MSFEKFFRVWAVYSSLPHQSQFAAKGLGDFANGREFRIAVF
jgi:hypothetical protein